MPSPDFPEDTPLEEETRRPAWWRRALAYVLRGANRAIGGPGNPEGAGRDLLPRSLGGGGRGG
jgi:hypothetical protein